MKRIFYFNITYGCNSNCVFCYSHNTQHNSKTFNEISSAVFFDYLDHKKLAPDDRVIINGGEPFLHTDIDRILSELAGYGCEVLIYTNGRLLTRHNLSELPEKYRFVIPIHGYECIHDSITQVRGSYQETLTGLMHLTETTRCLVDIKIIINNIMLSEDYTGEKLIASLPNLSFNNAVHITKMADTRVSMKNGCESIANNDAAWYTALLFKYFKDQNRRIKVFDTCVERIPLEKNGHYKKYGKSIVVYFKDRNQYREIELGKRPLECMSTCECMDKCVSAVDEYKVFEYFDGIIFENLE